MAIPDTLAARIIEHVKTHDLSGHLLMLGRQRWLGGRRGPAKRMFENALKKYLPDLSEEDFANPADEYSETFFSRIGFETVDSLDMSDFEQASIIADLGGEIPEELHDRFDVIYDGGTCEHVFDLPTAYRNIDKMLKTGGVLIGHSPCNNWINHGFYQICPEMVYGFWQRSLGYEVLACNLQPLHPRFARQSTTTSNPLLTGKRPRLRGPLPNSRIIIDYAVRKTVPSEEKASVFQTDYSVRWSAAAEPAAG